jgi:hypothetical protein
MAKDVEGTWCEPQPPVINESNPRITSTRRRRRSGRCPAASGLAAPSTHTAYAMIGGSGPVLDDSAAVGHRSIVIPYLDDETGTADIWKKVADNLNRAGGHEESRAATRVSQPQLRVRSRERDDAVRLLARSAGGS